MIEAAGMILLGGSIGAVVGGTVMTLVWGLLHARGRELPQVRRPEPAPCPPMPTVRFRIDPPGVMLRVKDLPMRDAQRLAAWFRLQ